MKMLLEALQWSLDVLCVGCVRVLFLIVLLLDVLRSGWRQIWWTAEKRMLRGLGVFCWFCFHGLLLAAVSVAVTVAMERDRDKLTCYSRRLLLRIEDRWR